MGPVSAHNILRYSAFLFIHFGSYNPPILRSYNRPIFPRF